MKKITSIFLGLALLQAATAYAATPTDVQVNQMVYAVNASGGKVTVSQMVKAIEIFNLQNQAQSSNVYNVVPQMNQPTAAQIAQSMQMISAQQGNYNQMTPQQMMQMQAAMQAQQQVQQQSQQPSVAAEITSGLIGGILKAAFQ